MSWFVTWDQKEGGIYLGPWIHDRWLSSQRTHLNMFSSVGEKIRSLSRKQSKLNFWNQLLLKIAFLCRFWTQTANWQPNHTILTSNVKAILKAMINTVFFGTKFRGVIIFYYWWEVFSTRESTLGLTFWSLSYNKSVCSQQNVTPVKRFFWRIISINPWQIPCLILFITENKNPRTTKNYLFSVTREI